MKFYCKPTLTLFLLLYVAIQSAQAQDTLRITLLTGRSPDSIERQSHH